MLNTMKMIKTSNICCYCIFFISIITLIIITGVQKYSVNLFQNPDGWGYDIFIRNKLFIHQPFMPSVSGEISFPDKRAARRVGRFIVRKLQKNQSPGITPEELDSLIKTKSIDNNHYFF